MENPFNPSTRSSVHRLESFYKEIELWEHSRKWNRILWFDNGRDMLYLPSGLPFLIERYPKGGWIVFITDENLNVFFQHYPAYFNMNLFNPESTHVHFNPSKSLIYELGSFADHFSNAIARHEKSHAMQPYMDLMLVKVAEAYEATNPVPLDDHSASVVRRFKELTVQHFKNRTLKTSWYANQLGLGERELSRLCLSRLRKNAKDHVDGVRVAYARQLLLTTGKAIKEIAIELGYEDNQGHFSTYFKRHTGQTPQQLRGMLDEDSVTENHL